MPPRSKRNAASRRHLHSSYSPDEPVLDLDPQPPADSQYSPAVFEVDPPPSDPERGRPSTLIRDSPARLDPIDCAQDTFPPTTSESDIDDGGPISPSTSPPYPSHLPAPPHAPPAPPRSALALSGLVIPQASAESDDSSLRRSVGHVRSPVLAREPTPLESFSRTIRNYVPSSIPIPSAAPSPPTVSRPVSFGSFLTPSTTATSPTRDRESRRRLPHSLPKPVSGTGEMPVFSLDDDIPEDPPRDDHARVTRYPATADAEHIIYAAWDNLVDSSHPPTDRSKPRSLLLLGYPTGLQVWDCSNLGSVSELLNLTGPHWGPVESAAVLPDPHPSVEDPYRQFRPLIAFSSRNVHGTEFIVYSLRNHEVIKRLALIALVSFAASSQCIVLCTSNPSVLRVISSSTFTTLYTIPSSSLVLSSASTTSSTKHNVNDVLSLDLDQHYLSTRSASLSRPIYTLSNRLLAYVSPINRHDPITTSTPGQAHTSIPVTAADPNSSKFALGMSQGELGSAAVKIGGSVLSGMKTLGGLAMSAARAGMSAAVAGEPAPARGRSTSTTGSSPAPPGGAFGMFFSKSAPAATSSPHEYQTNADRRRRSLRVSSPAVEPPSAAVLDAEASASSLGVSVSPDVVGCTVTVVDVQAVIARGEREPEVVAQFAFAKPQAPSGLRFSADGTTLAVCAKDGRAVRVLQLRPAPRTTTTTTAARAKRGRRAASVRGEHDGEEARATVGDEKDRARARSCEVPGRLAESMQHVYTLHRGRTSAVVESMEWAHDKVWFGMSSRKRTVHVFAVNPLGGRPDGGSHLTGKVVNSTDLVSSSMELSPLVRVRLKPLPQDSPNKPCVFTFLRSSETTLPPSLLPPASVHFSPSASSSPSSITSSGLAKPVSPAQRPTRPTNYKDLLVFDPNDGTLSLHRIFVERAVVDQAVIPESIPVAGGMSISLPGMSTLSRMSQSGTPPIGSSGASPRTASGLTQMMEKATEMVGKESVVSTWLLARGRDWPEVKQNLGQQSSRSGHTRATRSTKSDWLSRAELSTFSPSPRILPRLVYLSHQFAFHALGEDYHALVRSLHLDVPSTKIEVRTPIEVSAFASSGAGAEGGDAFVQALGAHHHTHHHHGAPSSFDEPLASALAAPLHPLRPAPPVLPMLPNGAPKSRIGAIPIRQVAAGIQDGMSGGLGRIRRELGRARSPPAAGLERETETVPLEFDEEDEDFVGVAAGAGAAAAVEEREVEANVVPRGVAASGAVVVAGGATAGSSPGARTDFAGAGAAVVGGGLEALPAEGGDGELVWEGWGPEEQEAVEEAERFDDITVGFMDEEHETMRETEVKMKKNGGKKQRKGGSRKA